LAASRKSDKLFVDPAKTGGLEGLVDCMPILKSLTDPADFVDPDEAPRSVVAYGLALANADFALDHHRHRKAQVLLVLRGVLTCEAQGGLWLVPPQSAIWIPGGMMHALKVSGAIEGYNAFIDPALTAGLPAACCTVAVTPLLRELLVRAASFPLVYPEGGAESHLVTLLLDELAAAPIERFHLPMPADVRLRKIVGMMMANPSDRGTMDTWADRAGLSERTMARLVVRETGMSFGRWRKQLTIMLALQWMAQGASIQRVAIGLGYDSAGSFVTMFRKTLGTSPARYMAKLRAAAGHALPS
jgi:AraC-like DNA-binding protein